MKIQDHYNNKIKHIIDSLLKCDCVIDARASLMDVNTPTERTKIDIFVNTKDADEIEGCLSLQDDMLDKYKKELDLYFNMRYIAPGE